MTRKGRLRGADVVRALNEMEASAEVSDRLRHLLRELREHLIDLEAENRELLDAQLALAAARDRDLREIQLRMSHAERLAKVGSMTMSITHEINNPLAFLMGNLTVVTRIVRDQARGAEEPRSEPSASPEVALKALADAQIGAERIQKIVRDLSAYTQPGGEQRFTVGSRTAPSPLHRENTVTQRLHVTESARRGRILIVDDELRLCQTLELLLGRAHDVVYTPSAREALDWILTGQSYDAILCDLMMADVTGKQFYDALCQHAPEYVRRVIFMTGGAYTPASMDFVAKMTNPILTKPFRPEELEKLLIALVPSV